ncbi:expressed protein [Arabidopsis lyrata subsp. lyrata]|uniref:Expressed protein n=1 Tax=Arabidopsis lyrata subsp. lyrata TaxID=81972 RepID=D7LB71_ARALL|nr:expressed protein [Arabidopsis lyrata subsp. lyrata]
MKNEAKRIVRCNYSWETFLEDAISSQPLTGLSTKTSSRLLFSEASPQITLIGLGGIDVSDQERAKR